MSLIQGLLTPQELTTLLKTMHHALEMLFKFIIMDDFLASLPPQFSASLTIIMLTCLHFAQGNMLAMQ